MIPLRLLGRILLLGLSIAQVLSTVQVYVSNLDYHRFLSSVQEAGYLAVPNERVFDRLTDFGPAFCGALFFTLTAGAALTLIASGAAWAWDRLFSRSRRFPVFLLFLLMLCLVSANLRGFSPLITGFLLVIPAPVFFCTLEWLPKRHKKERYTDTLLPLFAFFLAASILLVWRPSIAGKPLFTDIRDRLLLSNSIGRHVNAFYYENSLYSTRVFKSPRQQLIKSCRLDGGFDLSLRKRITEALLSRDYLPLHNVVRPDLRLLLTEGHLEFYDYGKPVLKTSIEEFLHNPAEPLKRIETGTARQPFLLGFTLFSILFVGALLLYASVYLPAYWLSGLFLRSTPRAIKAEVLWPFVLLALYFAFTAFAPKDLSDPEGLPAALNSDRPAVRIAGLKYILRSGIDIARFPAYQNHVHSRTVAERYWLAKALGRSRTPETRRSLHELLADPQFNVVCMALDSLGRRGGRADVPVLLGKLKTSANWYVQWYAYRALRRLGWRQEAPKEKARMGAEEGSHPLLCHQFGQ